MTVILPGGLGQLMASRAYSAWATNYSSAGAPPGYIYNTAVPVFSNNNRSVTAGSGGVVVTTGASFRTAGKLYFETTFTKGLTDGLDVASGVAGTNWSITNPGYDSAQQSIGVNAAAGPSWWLYFGGAQVAQFVGLGEADGAIIGVAANITAAYAQVWFRYNAYWLGQGTPTTTFPSASPDEQISFTTSGTGLIIVGTAGPSGPITLNTGNAAWANAPPAGYSAWG